jgi:hypothetical protein
MPRGRGHAARAAGRRVVSEGVTMDELTTLKEDIEVTCAELEGLIKQVPAGTVDRNYLAQALVYLGAARAELEKLS